MDINNANDNDTIDLKKLFSLMIEKKKIVNTSLGEVWIENLEQELDWKRLVERREDYEAEVPDGVLLLTAAPAPPPSVAPTPPPTLLPTPPPIAPPNAAAPTRC